MVVVSHLFLFLRKSFRGRFDLYESNLPLFGTIYFPTAPVFIFSLFIDREVAPQILLHLNQIPKIFFITSIHSLRGSAL